MLGRRNRERGISQFELSLGIIEHGHDSTFMEGEGATDTIRRNKNIYVKKSIFASLG